MDNQLLGKRINDDKVVLFLPDYNGQ